MQFTELDRRREQWVYGGWNIGEPDPMASAQSKRFWAQLTPADGPQSQFHGAGVPDQRTERTCAAAPEVMAG